MSIPFRSRSGPCSLAVLLRADLIQLPFNNTCSAERGQMPSMSRSGSGLEILKAPTRHVKKTLPPTLTGFPGEAEIRYFVKATVKMHSFFKENPRAYMPFKFFPIEPPRPPSSGTEVYARQKHQFNTENDSAKSKMKSIFRTSATASNDAPHFSVDVRLPEPAILTCNDTLPLRIIVKKLNDCDAMLYLQSLQISLIGSTKIKAHDVHRTETNSWIIMSKANMGIPIGSVSDPADTETALDDHLWRGERLPNTVAPSFETCNISRQYALDVRIGLSYAGATQSASKVRKGQIQTIVRDRSHELPARSKYIQSTNSVQQPQTVVLPLRLDTLVYSGITPPQELLDAMAEARAGVRPPTTTASSSAVPNKLRTEGRKQSSTKIPTTPLEAPASIGSMGAPALPGHRPQQSQPPEYSDAPPSYEDAVATDMPPVDAPRPDYAPPPAGDDDVLGMDEKRRPMH